MRVHLSFHGCKRRGMLALCFFLAAVGHAMAQVDPLPSWNPGPAKQSILTFVEETTNKQNPRYVEPEDRVATFDQDGTLWVEHPLYTQAAFALDRLSKLSPAHPEWRTQQPFQAVLTGNPAAISNLTEADWIKILAVTHAGMSSTEFHDLVDQWITSAKAPRFNRSYTDLVYEPMLEVMRYMREKGFKTYIVTGGGQEFVRVYSERVYGIPPEQVVGSSVATSYEQVDGKSRLMRNPKVFFVADGPGKVIGINLFIGRQPIAAFGNSTGDAQMLQWTQAGEGVRLMMLVLHDDAVREYAYGPAGGLPETHVGTFPQALMVQAQQKGWTVISMQKDWKRIFNFDH